MNDTCNPYEGLEHIINQDCHDQKPHIFLHPYDYGLSHVSQGLREYTDEEVWALEKRDFETRIFISSSTFEGDSVFLRTHWTENHMHKTVLNSVRDFFKAFHATRNYTAAKAALSELLTMCLEAEKSNYYSFAITMASALSDDARNTSFQVHNAMVKSSGGATLARKKLCLLMHNLFQRIKSSEFLYSGEGSNIYRLTHCKTYVSSKGNIALIIPAFTFVLQLVLVAFVTIHQLVGDTDSLFRDFAANFRPDRSEKDDANSNVYAKLLLAFATFIYSAIIAWPGIIEIGDAYKLFDKKIGPLQMLDFFANTIIPIFLLLNSFFLIVQSDTYLDAVLNTAALLFIPEIDDDLPGMIGYNESIIVKNYLVKKLLKEFDEWCLLEDKNVFKLFHVAKDSYPGLGVQFADYYLTNLPEQGSVPEENSHFKPYEVTAGRMRNGIQLGHQVNPVNSVNENCLIRKIYWSYTTTDEYKYTIKPRIGYLRLEMINGEVIEINMKGVDKSLTLKDVYHKLEGVFIITSFQMSSSILKLRVCGSRTAEDFLTAFDYYSLWEITPPAERLLEDYQKHLKTYQPMDPYKTYMGKPPTIKSSPSSSPSTSLSPGSSSFATSSPETILSRARSSFEGIGKSLFKGDF